MPPKPSGILDLRARFEWAYPSLRPSLYADQSDLGDPVCHKALKGISKKICRDPACVQHLQCVPTKGGNCWVVVPLRRASSSPGHTTIHWELLFVDSQGRTIRWPAQRLRPIEDHYNGQGGLSLQLLANDYDGDGEQEAILLRKRTYHGDGSTAYERAEGILAYRGARVIATKAPPFSDVADVDGDGRYDLVYYPYDTRELYDDSCFDPAYARGRYNRPKFIVHARKDGSFSADDDTAQRVVRAYCPSTVELDKLANQSPEYQLYQVMCARLHGRSTSDVLGAIKRSCPRTKPRPANSSRCDAWKKNSAPKCLFRDTLIKWARQKAPLEVAVQPGSSKP